MKPLPAVAIVFASSASLVLGQPCENFWDPAAASWSFRGGRGLGLAVKEYAPQGQAPTLFVGGQFGRSGDTRLENIAVWDGSQWVQPGELPGTVNDLEVFDDGSGPQLYAGGRFRTGASTTDIGVRRWTGAGWTGVSGPDGTVTDLQVYNDGSGLALYACGSFMTAAGLPAPGIARYRNGQWTRVGNTNILTVVGSPQTMTFSSILPRAGLTVGGTPALAVNNAIRWNGTSWVNDAVSGNGLEVIRLGRLGDRMYASVNFTGGLFQATTTWTALPGAGAFQYTGTAYAMQEFNDGRGAELFIGGDFDLFSCSTNPCTSAGLAAFNGTTWRPVRPTGWQEDPLLNAGVVRAMGTATSPNRLVFTGSFDGVRQTATPIGQPLPAPTIAMNSVGSWDGTQFAAFGPGISLPGAKSMIVVNEGGEEVTYVGGDFQTINGVAAPCLAKFSDGVWSSPIPDLNGAVRQIVSYQGGLVLRGDFTRAGGLTVQGVVRLSPTGAVSALPTFPFGSVRASALVSGLWQGSETLFVAASGINGFVARFQPAGTSGSWMTMTSGASFSDVLLAPDGQTLYAVGAQGSTLRAIRFVGLSQQNLTLAGVFLNAGAGRMCLVPEGSGLTLYVNALFQTGGQLSNLARLNSTTGVLTPVGTDSFLLSDLDVFDDGSGPAMYGAGNVQLAEGQAALVRWTGTRWERAGNFNRGAESLYVRQTPSSGSLAVLGDFTRIENLDADGFAVLRLCDFCAADINRDARVDADDVIEFFAGWDTGAPSSDFDGSGGVDGDDVIQFFDHWDRGC